jgi:hypothetical protein
VTITLCSRSSSDVSVFTFFARGPAAALIGPAAIVFFLGLPGTLPASTSFGLTVVFRGSGLCRAGEAEVFGGLVITRFLQQLGE